LSDWYTDTDGSPVTYCLGIKVDGGLVAVADTRITRGSERLNKAKLSLVPVSGPVFLMTSGLRSVRDKAVLYLEEQCADSSAFLRVHEVASAFGRHLRAVREEDEPSLAAAGLAFNLNAIIGGRLSGDTAPALFYVYPEGNWIEIGGDSPYFAMGRTPYGRPILDRLLRSDTPLQSAIALAYLAFDATRTSVNDVDFPIDLAVYDSRADRLRTQRFDEDALLPAAEWWQARLAMGVGEFPLAWAESLLDGTTQTGASKAHN
jgi:putative proteasome-type protease